MTDKKTDFFWGETSTETSLNDILNKFDTHTPSYITHQLNRLLECNDGRLKITDSTSSPAFYKLLDNLAHSEIDAIHIGVGAGENQPAHTKVYCLIWLKQGVVLVDAYWCAYKEQSAYSLIQTLLLPLHTRKLKDKAFIKTTCSSNVTYSKLSESGSLSAEVKSLLTLAKCSVLSSSTEFIEKCVARINEAEQE